MSSETAYTAGSPPEQQKVSNTFPVRRTSGIGPSADRQLSASDRGKRTLAWLGDRIARTQRGTFNPFPPVQYGNDRIDGAKPPDGSWAELGKSAFEHTGGQPDGVFQQTSDPVPSEAVNAS